MEKKFAEVVCVRVEYNIMKIIGYSVSGLLDETGKDLKKSRGRHFLFQSVAVAGAIHFLSSIQLTLDLYTTDYQDVKFKRRREQ